MDQDRVPDDKRMRLRFAGTCRICDAELPAKTEAFYERFTKTVRCLTHQKAPVDPGAEVAMLSVEVGIPGASARREFERRKAKRDDRIRTKHPRLGGLVLALSDEPQTTTAWNTGALGEERLGARFNEMVSDSLLVLHDRRIPGTKANIDHIVVSSTGVYVVDAKKYKGRPRLKLEGGLLRPRVEKLYVGSRHCTKLVDGMLKQIALVRGVVAEHTPVHGVMCFVEADWPLFGGAFTTREVEVLWPKKLYPALTANGPLTNETIAHLHRDIALAFPPA